MASAFLQSFDDVSAVLGGRPGKTSVPIHVVPKEQAKKWLASQNAVVKGWAKSIGFEPRYAKSLLMPKRDGGLAGVLFVQPESASPFEWARLPGELPKGRYHLAGAVDVEHAEAAALGWALALYRFDRYKRKPSPPSKKLAWPEGADQGRVKRLIEATYLVRDLVNLPANDLGPAELAEAAEELAERHGAALSVTTGDALAEGFPMVHAVGAAAVPARGPRLIDITWGDAAAPKVTLVGKGVCF
ncbi:MAG: leucyl aminopeptidase family protein, partial [Myxococcales bacterium]|nr:leucyl aminopeptidase family protein [Myxococcales bacterium]